MYIQEISSKTEIIYAIKGSAEKPSEIKTTVDLSKLGLRSRDQNIIQKIQWVYWLGEAQGLVTLADGATLFFEPCGQNTVFHMKIGDYIDISSCTLRGMLAGYSLRDGKDNYTIRDQFEGSFGPFNY